MHKVLPSGVAVVNFNVAYKAPPSVPGGERLAEWCTFVLQQPNSRDIFYGVLLYWLDNCC